MTDVGSKKLVAEGRTDMFNQQTVSRRNPAARQDGRKQRVHRASVACASCRERRIRCIVPKGENRCTRCKRTGTDCVINNNDGRRRPISKAYISSLSERIVLLEGMLVEKGVPSLPVAQPPKAGQDAQNNASEVQAQLLDVEPDRQGLRADQRAPLTEVQPLPNSVNGHLAASDRADGIIETCQRMQPLPKDTSLFRMLDPHQEDIIHRLLSTKNNLLFDQLSGRLRFFGPTANCHVYTKQPDQLKVQEPPEQVHRAERIIRSLTVVTHDYLMHNFWAYYNSVLNIVDQEAFEADRESQNPSFYSSFLHVTVLAMGFRFADLGREDIKRIALGGRHSTLHREAKYMLDMELERPGGIPSVQALLLLGDLECGVGRDNTEWAYSGMANRLAFDLGLHLDYTNHGISETEADIRRMAMCACVIYDKYWALFLGRPTSIKDQDVGIDLPPKRFSQMPSVMEVAGSTTDKQSQRRDMEIYERLIELMNLAGRILETGQKIRVFTNGCQEQDGILNNPEGEDTDYLHVINLDRQLQNWYRHLPDHLQWEQANIKTAPVSFFLLHQQYHVSMILLHRPWAKYGATSAAPDAATGDSAAADHLPLFTPLGTGAHSRNSEGMPDPRSMEHDSRASLSRSICTHQAVRVAQVFWQHRQRFQSKRIFITGIQHAGTAAIALIAALAYQRSKSERRTYLGCLETLSAAVSDMAHTYHPAALMNDLLCTVLTQLRTDMDDASRYSRGNWRPPSPVAGSELSTLSETSWRGTMDNNYSVLSIRCESGAIDAEHRDAHKLYHKRRSPTGIRPADDFPREPPPFLELARLTPPKSLRGRQPPPLYGTNAVDPSLYTLDGGAGGWPDQSSPAENSIWTF